MQSFTVMFQLSIIILSIIDSQHAGAVSENLRSTPKELKGQAAERLLLLNSL